MNLSPTQNVIIGSNSLEALARLQKQISGGLAAVNDHNATYGNAANQIDRGPLQAAQDGLDTVATALKLHITNSTKPIPPRPAPVAVHRPPSTVPPAQATAAPAPMLVKPSGA